MCWLVCLLNEMFLVHIIWQEVIKSGVYKLAKSFTAILNATLFLFYEPTILYNKLYYLLMYCIQIIILYR